MGSPPTVSAQGSRSFGSPGAMGSVAVKFPGPLGGPSLQPLVEVFGGRAYVSQAGLELSQCAVEDDLKLLLLLPLPSKCWDYTPVPS